MIRKIATAALATAVLAITACNTVHGVGKDMSSAGNAVQNAGK